MSGRANGPTHPPPGHRLTGGCRPSGVGRRWETRRSFGSFRSDGSVPELTGGRTPPIRAAPAPATRTPRTPPGPPGSGPGEVQVVGAADLDDLAFGQELAGDQKKRNSFRRALGIVHGQPGPKFQLLFDEAPPERLPHGLPEVVLFPPHR